MWRLISLIAVLLIGCSQTVDQNQVLGCYKLVNGPFVELGLYRNNHAQISDDAGSSIIKWSFENDQVFLSLPPHFFLQLSQLSNQVTGINYNRSGYFGLIPQCDVHDSSCRLDIEFYGHVYFERYARIDVRQGGACPPAKTIVPARPTRAVSPAATATMR